MGRHRKAELLPGYLSGSRLKEGAAPATVNRELAALSHLFTKAIEWRWIDKRPAAINRFQEERGRVAYLTVEQIDRLVEAAARDDDFDGRDLNQVQQVGFAVPAAAYQANSQRLVAGGGKGSGS